ncbi:helix-turn-helix domain-containing protein [Salmonella enterica]|nr:helix-turn-helix domain-containing protein [Salmonella enterica]
MSNGFGEKLKAIREAEGLTQLQLSKEIDISMGSISNYESGFRDAGISIIAKFTNHPRFEKYTLWLMSEEGKTNEVAGQVSPALSPDGQDSTSSRRNAKKAG